jgi:multiple sugar transport system substrate-binding protein/sn-glycerol 3-phosphate transport system substrate-binding protein
MKLFKQISILLVLLLVAGAVFATGTTEDSSAGTSGADPLAGVDPTGATVTYWHQHSREREEGLNAMIDRFNQTNEWGITVVGEYQGGYSDIYNKMITGLAGGEVPNLVVAYQNQASGYQVADGLVDMTPYVESPEYGIEDPSDFFEGFYLQDINAQFDNERLGFPPNRSAEVMYYNKTWLEELGYDAPPATWDEFAEMVAAATDPAAGTYGYALRTDASNVYAMVISRGGEIAAPGGAGYQFDTPEMRDSMEFMKGLYDAGYVKMIAESYGDQTDFGNRLVLFTMGSTSGLPFYQMAVDAGENGTFEWSVAPPPHTTPRAAVNVYGASVSIPKTTPEQQLAAWLFVRWMSEPEQQAEWVRISNYFPVRRSVANNLGDYFAENPRFEDAFNILQTSDTSAEPPYAGYDEVRDLMAGAYNAIIDGADIDETLADLEAEANEVHELASP